MVSSFFRAAFTKKSGVAIYPSFAPGRGAYGNKPGSVFCGMGNKLGLFERLFFLTTKIITLSELFSPVREFSRLQYE
jgi:hypothetical protein